MLKKSVIGGMESYVHICMYVYMLYVPFTESVLGSSSHCYVSVASSLQRVHVVHTRTSHYI